MDNHGEIIIYQTEDGLTKINVNMQDETVWLSLDQMSELFQRDKSTISRHIKNVYAEGELKKEATVANFATVQKEGQRSVERQIEHYNLDVIISVGYRVKSVRGTQFRIWASSVLKEYIKKGFAMDDERLKGNGGVEITGRKSLTAFVTSVHLKKYYTARCWICMPQAWITIRAVKSLFSFLKSYKISCIMQRMAILCLK